jgi:hypothetical protein
MSGPVPADLIAALRETHGRLRLLLAVLRAPRPRRAPVPADPHPRADLGLAPVANPALVAGSLWLRVL